MKVSITFILSFFLCLFGTQAALLGIDFGTEYTKSILVAPGVPFDILLTSESKRKDISGLSILLGSEKENPQVLRKYGTQALATCIKNPESCTLYMKSLLGVGKADEGLNDYRMKFQGVGLGDQTGRDAVSVVVNDKTGENSQTFLVEEIVAMIFLEIKNRAMDYWKERSPETLGTIDEVVISVPRYFNEAARLALADAAELAGMKVVALVDDGLAVALDYAQKRNDFQPDEKEYHLIFDAGAGSTKATLVSFTNVNGTIDLEILNYASNDKFNGELFTVMVRAIILEQFSEKEGIPISDILFDTRSMKKVWQAAEKAKLILSANTETSVTIESFYNDIDFKGFITRGELESKMEISLSVIPQMLDAAFQGFDIKKDIKSVILTGGSVRVPIIQEYLVDYLGSDELLSKNVNADESVVFGTTIRGAQLLKLTRKSQFNIIDHNPFDYKINYNCANGKYGVIDVPKGILSNEKFSTNLTEFKDEFIPEIKVDILQGGNVLTHKFNYTMPKRFNETSCDGGIDYILNYGFSKSNIFNVHNIKINCYSIKNGSISETPKVSNMISESRYYGFEKMPNNMKQISLNRLAQFDKMDMERQKMSDSRNNLEGKLYEIRYLLEEYEDILPSDMYDEISLNITSELEWLDYDSDDAVLSDITKKYQNTKRMEKDLQIYISVSDYDLAIENIKVAYEELLIKREETEKNVNKILAQDKILEEECALYDIDYNTTISKVYGSVWPDDEIIVKIDNALDDIKAVVEVLDSTSDAQIYAKMDHNMFVDAVKKITTVGKSLDPIVGKYKMVFDARSEFINSQYLSRAKKAAKKAAAAKESKTSSTTTIATDTINTHTTTTSEINHDEL